MSKDLVDKRLVLIHACQEIGQVWMAQIIIAYMLDRLLLAGLPNKVWVNFPDSISE